MPVEKFNSNFSEKTSGLCYDEIKTKGIVVVKIYLILFLVLVVVFAVQSYNMNKAKREKLKKELDEKWGRKAERKYPQNAYERISHFYQQTKQKNAVTIDDITWNDLSMDDVFRAMNHTYSSVGEESLYRRLRTLELTEEKLKAFGAQVSCFEQNEKAAKELQEEYASIGRTKSISLYDFIMTASGLTAKSNRLHYVCDVLLLGCIAGFFVVPQYAVLAFVAVLSYNIYTYYKEKNDVNNYFVCFEYIIGLIRHGEKIRIALKELDDQVFGEYIEKIGNLLNKTKGLKKGMFLISSQGVDDSVIEMIMQYVRMIFHVDLIKFNVMVKKVTENIEEIKELYEITGDVEAAIATASFRVYLKNNYDGYAVPQFHDGPGMEFDEIYHPLIPKAVKNSMKREQSMLLTGSNASGKSTFLKTVAINGILAQTIYTSAASRFILPPSEIYSSMALRDNLSQNDSYYMAEIKSIKRILDKAAEGKEILCFIDEVLRGTNTIERIAASSEILKALKRENVICFAATHDIELTYILEDDYANYHFEEEVSGDDVKFNYHLNKGRTVTRNAIRLLKVLGYPSEIVEGAMEKVSDFTETGKWI